VWAPMSVHGLGDAAGTAGLIDRGH
jgi:hypothetical protein